MCKNAYNNKTYRINRGVVIYNANCHCDICNKVTASLEVHHIDGDNRNNDIGNLSAVCNSCHKLLHKSTLTHVG